METQQHHDVALDPALLAQLVRETPEATSLAARALERFERGMRHFARRQLDDGHWSGDYGGPMFLLPGLVIAHHITGAPLSDYQRERMITYLRNTQTPEGGWGLHIASPSTVLGTALNYTALRLLGVSRDDALATRARSWLLAHGGTEGIPTWGKVWLAVLGVYSWDGVNPIAPELWLLPEALPVHPSRFWCHTRAVYLPMSYLYGRRAVGPQTALVRELRDELYTQPWHTIDWPALRTRVAEGDLYTPPSSWLRALNRALAGFERLAPSGLRRRALDYVIDQIHHEDESTSYLTIGPVSKALHMVAVWFDDPESGAFRRHLERVEDYLWDGDDGMKMQGYNGSQLWDLAFAMQALLDSGRAGADAELDDVLRRAHDYLDAQQVRCDIADGERYFRDRIAGCWPFSTAEQAWPVSDCTAEGLKVAIAMTPRVEQPIAVPRLQQAVDRLLEQQNRDGGWSEYERARSTALIEHINPAEVFGDIMVGHSYAECTSACIQGLMAFRRYQPTYRAPEIDRAVAAGAQFLRRCQRADGSWYGGWGICFTYGTWFGIEGLLAAGEPAHGPLIARACRFLLSKQRADGGWGESYRSCVEQRWVEAERSQVVQTAWAVLGLLAARHAGCPVAEQHAIDRGIELLLQRQREDGGWSQEDISGVFNRNCMIHYDNYRYVMPLWALGRYHRVSTAQP